MRAAFVREVGRETRTESRRVCRRFALESLAGVLAILDAAAGAATGAGALRVLSHLTATTAATSYGSRTRVGRYERSPASMNPSSAGTSRHDCRVSPLPLGVRRSLLSSVSPEGSYLERAR